MPTKLSSAHCSNTHAQCGTPTSQKTAIKLLDKIQNRAARWVTNRYRRTSHVGEMLESLAGLALTGSTKKENKTGDVLQKSSRSHRHGIDTPAKAQDTRRKQDGNKIDAQSRGRGTDPHTHLPTASLLPEDHHGVQSSPTRGRFSGHPGTFQVQGFLPHLTAPLPRPSPHPFPSGINPSSSLAPSSQYRHFIFPLSFIYVAHSLLSFPPPSIPIPTPCYLPRAQCHPMCHCGGRVGLHPPGVDSKRKSNSDSANPNLMVFLGG